MEDCESTQISTYRSVQCPQLHPRSHRCERKLLSFYTEMHLASLILQFVEYTAASAVFIIPGIFFFVYLGDLADDIRELSSGDSPLDATVTIIIAVISGALDTVNDMDDDSRCRCGYCVGGRVNKPLRKKSHQQETHDGRRRQHAIAGAIGSGRR